MPGCELITGAEIQEATGLAPGRSEEGPRLVRDCNWYIADDRPLVGVVVGAAPRTYEEYLRNMREQLGSDMDGLEMSRVTGVGNYAVWHTEGYLNVAEGNHLLVVWIFAEPAGDKPKRERQPSNSPARPCRGCECPRAVTSRLRSGRTGTSDAAACHSEQLRKAVQTLRGSHMCPMANTTESSRGPIMQFGLWSAQILLALAFAFTECGRSR